MIYIIGDLHIGFSVTKPMNIFGENWENHSEKIKQNWLSKVKSEDTVVLPGDFSWAMDLEEAKLDFKFLNDLPGKKILLKGNHDYWWTTVKKMNDFLKANDFENIYFLFNNSYFAENKILVGTRGWASNNPISEEDYMILKRECLRLESSIKDGISKYGDDKEVIAFFHYPPFYKEEPSEEIDFIKILKKYGVKKCYYGHLHGSSHKEAIEGVVNRNRF